MQTNDVVVQSLLPAVGAAVLAGLVAGMPRGAFVVVCRLAVTALGLALTFRLGPHRRDVPLPAA